VVHREGLKLLGARGKRLEYGAHRAAAMADGSGSSRTSAREGRRGLANNCAGRSVGVGRNVPVPLGHVGGPRAWPATCAAPVANGTPRAVRRRRIRATWPSHLPRMARTSARWHCAVTSGHTSASACAPEAGTARTAVADVAAHDVAPWTRSGVLRVNVFH
jgi:hypothetical protein